MPMLLRLPLMLLELLLRGGASTLKDLLRRLPAAPATSAPTSPAPRRRPRPPPRPPPAATPSASPPPRRPRGAPPRAPAPPGGAPGRRPIRPVEPAPEPAPAHVSEEAEQVASFGPSDDPGSTIEVQAPWPRYDEHSAAEVIKRVRSGDEATRAVVLLYERTHKARKSVIAAAETSPS